MQRDISRLPIHVLIVATVGQKMLLTFLFYYLVFHCLHLAPLKEMCGVFFPFFAPCCNNWDCILNCSDHPGATFFSCAHAYSACSTCRGSLWCSHLPLGTCTSWPQYSSIFTVLVHRECSHIPMYANMHILLWDWGSRRFSTLLNAHSWHKESINWRPEVCKTGIFNMDHLWSPRNMFYVCVKWPII